MNQQIRKKACGGPPPQATRKTVEPDAVSVRLLDAAGEPLPVLEGGEEIVLEISVAAPTRAASPALCFELRDRLGQLLFTESTPADAGQEPLDAGDSMRARFRFRAPYLKQGHYAVSAGLTDSADPKAAVAWSLDALIFEVVPDDERYGLAPIKSANLINVEGSGNGGAGGF